MAACDFKNAMRSRAACWFRELVSDCRREDDVGLNLLGDRTHKLGSWNRKDVRNDDHAELSFACGHHLGNGLSLRSYCFCRECLCDAHVHEQAIQMDRAGTFLKVGNGFDRKQRLLECVDSADVRNLST